MASFLTEIALQLKGNLAFILGLGGMFTIARGLLVGLFVLPKISSDRPSIQTRGNKLRRQLTGCAMVSLVLFVAALVIYVCWLNSIDADALKKSHALLTIPQQWATGILTLIAIVMVLIESWVSVLKYRFDLLSRV